MADATPPSIDSFNGLSQDAGAGAAPSSSVQALRGSTVTLSWSASGADSFELTEPGAGVQTLDGSARSASVTPLDGEQDYTLVAIAGDARSGPATVHVSTHDAGEVVSSHTLVTMPSTDLSGTASSDGGDPLPNWPLLVTDASGDPLTPLALSGMGGSATPAPQNGVFVTGPDGSYAISGAPAGAQAAPVAPNAPVDTSNGPVPATGGTAQSDGGTPNKLVAWIKAKGKELENTRAGEVVMDDAGEAVGYAELLGVRYPVKAYQAQVSPALTRGSRLDAAGLQDLASRGFHGVVNFCKEYDDSAAVRSAGMNPLHLSVLDNTAPTYAEIKQFLDFVQTPANQPAYCHCEAGVGRTGVFCASYRMAVQRWSTADAIAEAQKYGLALYSQITFLQQLGADIAAGRIDGYPLAS